MQPVESITESRLVAEVVARLLQVDAELELLMVEFDARDWNEVAKRSRYLGRNSPALQSRPTN